MTIDFEIRDNKLILVYSPEQDPSYYNNSLINGESVLIKHAFCVNRSIWLEYNEVFEARNVKHIDDFVAVELRFVIGEIGNEYTKLYASVTNTKHSFYFSNDINLRGKMFVANRGIAILPKVDALIDRDMYIGGKWEEKNGIPYAAYSEMLNDFPTTTELNKYASSRIANTIKEYFPVADKYEAIFNKYLLNQNKKNIKLNSDSNLKIELAQFTTALEEIRLMLDSKHKEKNWQEKVQDILLLLYPKYILSTREIRFPGIDGKDKQPDYILVDSNGYIDIMEIKEPDCKILTKQASYRNNYVPRRELVGAVQQIEKYRYCLLYEEKSRKVVLSKLEKRLPKTVQIDIVNPQGIVLLGRSKDFNGQQKKDFELVKRQYKNIADIMTYDDLVHRLENIVEALKLRVMK